MGVASGLRRGLVTSDRRVCSVGQEAVNGPHEWLDSSRPRVRLMASIERDGFRPTLAGIDRPSQQIHDEGPARGRRLQRLLSVGGAADYLGVSRATGERLVNRGELPFVKIGGSTRYDVEDLDAYITTNRSRNRKRTA